MALFTGKGDQGTTKVFGCDQRISKSSNIAEALGTLDEINSFLGIVKVKSEAATFEFAGTSFKDIVNEIQQNLFIIQAELAGSKDKTIAEEKLRAVEKIINDIEKELPPIHSFFVSGGSELASLFDFARTLSRRAERRVVAVVDNKEREIGERSRAYLNRLSSILYALARLSNHKSGITEQSPTYK